MEPRGKELLAGAVSPMRRTGSWVRDIFFNMVMHRRMAGDWPTTSSKVYLARYPLCISWLRSSCWRFSASLKGCRMANAPMQSSLRSTGTTVTPTFTLLMRITLGSIFSFVLSTQ